MKKIVFFGLIGFTLIGLTFLHPRLIILITTKPAKFGDELNKVRSTVARGKRRAFRLPCPAHHRKDIARFMHKNTAMSGYAPRYINRLRNLTVDFATVFIK